MHTRLCTLLEDTLPILAIALGFCLAFHGVFSIIEQELEEFSGQCWKSDHF
jgi:hypothetical protein